MVKLEKGKKESSMLIYNIDIRQIERTSQDIASWRTAIQAAESVFNPTRKRLYDLYSDMILDGQLTSVMNKRIDSICNANIQFIGADGKEREDIMNDIVETENFDYILTEIINSRFWGYTLLEFDNEMKAHLVDRRYVKPEFNIVVNNPYQIEGINYTEPPYDRLTLTAGQPKSLGLLMKAAQYVIYKRGNFGDWAKYAELFGMPFRKATYPMNDPATRDLLNTALDEAGSAAYIVIPEGTEMEIIQNSGTSGSNTLYESLRKACNEEIAYIIVGQTMTSSDGSSRSQAEVHQNEQQQILLSDRRFVSRILNEKYMNVLRNMQSGIDGGHFVIQELESLSKNEKVRMVLDIKKNGTPVSDDYIYEISGIPKPDDYDSIKAEAKAKEEAKAEAEAKAKEVLIPQPTNLLGKIFNKTFEFQFGAELDNYYKIFAAKKIDLDEKLLDQYLKSIYNGSTKDIDIAVIKQDLKGLLKAFKSGWTDLIDINPSNPDYDIAVKLGENLTRFSLYKNFDDVQRLKTLAKDHKSFAKFKQEALEVRSNYNINYSNAESYRVARSAEAAKEWQEIDRNKDIYPNLRYIAILDERTRNDHVSLDGLVYPVDHPFWDSHYPPNDWGCRCTVEQTDDATNESSNPLEIPGDFANNPGKSGDIFEKHPYFNAASDKLDSKATDLFKTIIGE